VVTVALMGAAMAQRDSAAKLGRQDVFTITGVEVDVTAADAARARNKALAEGQREAFDMLMRRLLRQEDRETLGTIEPVLLNALIQGFEIVDERSSSVRYLAKLRVRFDGERVQDFLRSRGLPFSQTVGRPILILPVMETAGLRLLWEEENLWRKAWMEHDLQNR